MWVLSWLLKRSFSKLFLIHIGLFIYDVHLFILFIVWILWDIYKQKSITTWKWNFREWLILDSRSLKSPNKLQYVYLLYKWYYLAIFRQEMLWHMNSIFNSSNIPYLSSLSLSRMGDLVKIQRLLLTRVCWPFPNLSAYQNLKQIT